jgi:hypothetical protein
MLPNPYFVKNSTGLFQCNSGPKISATFSVFKKTSSKKQSPRRRKFAQSGHPASAVSSHCYFEKPDKIEAGYVNSQF